MKLVIRQFHASSSASALNEEWFVVENVGDKPFSTQGCAISVGKGKSRLRQLGTLDPGFTIAPGERVRVVTGNPGKKAQGSVPEEDGVRNYHLFLNTPLLSGAGTVVALTLRQHEVARGTYDASAPAGVVA